MIARLWWKDARQFWPIWGILVAAALATQGLILRLAADEGGRHGLLVGLAMGWGWLHALAVGAAAFAGEREAGTLRFLDVLPVRRSTLWLGKSTFALASTALLAAALVGLAALATDRVQIGSERDVGYVNLVGSLASPLLLAVALGLFWSSVTRTALSAAILASACAMATLGAPLSMLDARGFEPRWGLALSELGLALALLAASAWRVTLPDRGRRGPGRGALRFRSPIVRDGDVASRVAASPARGHSRRAIPVLLAETIRRGFLPWCLMAAVALVPTLAHGLTSGQVDLTLSGVFAVIAMVGCGVMAFHGDTIRGTHRFLAQHGVRPGVVWGVRVGAWGAAAAMLLAAIGMLASSWRPTALTPTESAVFLLTALPMGFAVGVLGGMVARRGITAFLVSLLATIALAVPLVLFVSARILPAPGVLAVPTALLLASWLWSGDWLLDRPAPGRWIRLGAWCAAIAFTLFIVYAPYRAWSVPETPALPAPESWGRRSGPNAADLYQRVQRELSYQGSTRPAATKFSEAWSPETPEGAAFLAENLGLLEAVRAASRLPDCQFFPPARRTLFGGPVAWEHAELARLVGLSAADRRARGDLRGAWDDILAVFQIARHIASGATVAEDHAGLIVEARGLALALEWAVDPRQTPEGLRAALGSYRARRPLPGPAEAIRGEAQLFERALDLPVKHLRSALEDLLGGRERAATFAEFAARDIVTTPWEITRARRVGRILLAREDRIVSMPASARPLVLPGALVTDSESYFWLARSSELLQTTPLARLILPNLGPLVARDDLNEAGRRALVLVIGLRLHLLTRGSYPAALAELVEELGEVPLDPAGGPFELSIRRTPPRLSIGASLVAGPAVADRLPEPGPGEGYPVLVARGGNRRLDGGRGDDLRFILPAGKAVIPHEPESAPTTAPGGFGGVPTLSVPPQEPSPAPSP